MAASDGREKIDHVRKFLRQIKSETYLGGGAFRKKQGKGENCNKIVIVVVVDVVVAVVVDVDVVASKVLLKGSANGGPLGVGAVWIHLVTYTMVVALQKTVILTAAGTTVKVVLLPLQL